MSLAFDLKTPTSNRRSPGTGGRTSRTWLGSLLLWSCLIAPLQAQVTLEQIMQDPDWIGNSPEAPYWSDDGRHLYYQQKRSGAEISDWYRLSLDGVSQRLEPWEMAAAGAPGGDWSQNRNRRVFAREGNLYLRDVNTGTLQQLTRTTSRDSNPFFLRDGSRIAFQRDGDVFVRDLITGMESQPFDVRTADDPDKEPERSYLEEQQRRLFEVIRLREERQRQRREHNEQQRAGDPTQVPPAWYIGKDYRISGRDLSPSGEHLVLRCEPPRSSRGQADNMPQWVTESGYVNNREVRPLVGTPPAPDQTLRLLDAATRQTHVIALDKLPLIADDPLADLKEAAKERQRAARGKAQEAAPPENEQDQDSPTKDEAENEPPVTDQSANSAATQHPQQENQDDVQDEATDADETAEDSGGPKSSGKPRSVSIFNVTWGDSGRHFAFQSRSFDNKDRWTCVYDVQTHELHVVEHLRNVEGWINGAFNHLGWLPNTDRLWYLSEASGYAHLYVWDAADHSSRQLTQGDFEIQAVTMLSEPSRVLALSNRPHPGIREVYSIDMQSGEMTRITKLEGVVGSLRGPNSIALSPDETQIAFLFSSLTRPDEIYVQALEPEAEARALTESRSEAFAAISWVVPEIVTIPSSKAAAPIYGRLYLPPDDAPRPEGNGKRPVVCFVHGAGYLQNVHYGWSSYFREFMFHTLLAQRGYVVLDLDYRASAGYGVEWRTAIYRRMGEPELEDYLDGIDWLVEHHDADPKRVGIYGGSYGGFLTFMALFKQPGRFAAGAALRPVTDWAHYNHGYTSNILNTPAVDPVAYERSSPIELVEGLQDPLLICHGLLDDNVFAKDAIRLVQRLIELEKENWELAVYPIEAHGFQEPSSWLDQYRRILKLFQTHLE